MTWSVMRKVWVPILKVKVRVIMWAKILKKYLLYPELLNLLQPNMVWWCIINIQGVL